MFGIKQRNALIRELIEWRMADSGFSDPSSRQMSKELSFLKIMGTPESTIVNIIETILIYSQRNAPLHEALEKLERKRGRIGRVPAEFNAIRGLSFSNSGQAVVLYCAYRIEVEHYGVMSSDQVEQVVKRAWEQITSW